MEKGAERLKKSVLASQNGKRRKKSTSRRETSSSLPRGIAALVIDVVD